MSYLFCVRLNSALKLQHTLQVKAKENTFCVRLNLAPKLQYTLQVKAKENTLQVKVKIHVLSGNNHGRCQNIGIYFCVWLNPAPRLQHPLQENENTCKNKEMFNLNYAPSDHPCKFMSSLAGSSPFPPVYVWRVGYPSAGL